MHNVLSCTEDTEPGAEPEPVEGIEGGAPADEGVTTDTEEDADPKCGPWEWSECQPMEGECGKGVKLGLREGEECKKTEKDKSCTLRCGGKRKGRT